MKSIEHNNWNKAQRTREDFPADRFTPKLVDSDFSWQVNLCEKNPNSSLNLHPKLKPKYC